MKKIYLFHIITFISFFYLNALALSVTMKDDKSVIKIIPKKETYSYYFYLYQKTADPDSALEYLIKAKNLGAPKDSLAYFFADYFLYTGDLENALIANLTIKPHLIKKKSFKVAVLNQRLYIYRLLDWNTEADKVYEELYNIKSKKNKLILTTYPFFKKIVYYNPIEDRTFNSSFNGVGDYIALKYYHYFKNFKIFAGGYNNYYLSPQYLSYQLYMGGEFFITPNQSIEVEAGYFNNNYSEPNVNAFFGEFGVNFYYQTTFSYINLKYQKTKNIDYQYLNPSVYFSKTLNSDIGSIKSSTSLVFLANFYINPTKKFVINFITIHGDSLSDSLTLQNGYYEIIWDRSDSLQTVYDTIPIIGSAFIIKDTIITENGDTVIDSTLKYLPYIAYTSTNDSIVQLYTDNYIEFQFGISQTFKRKNLFFTIYPYFDIIYYPKVYLFNYDYPMVATAIDTSTYELKNVLFVDESSPNKDAYVADSWDVNAPLYSVDNYIEKISFGSTHQERKLGIKLTIGYKNQNNYFAFKIKYEKDIDGPYNAYFVTKDISYFMASVVYRKYIRW